MRYRDLEGIDLGAARTAVCAWLDEHQGGTLVQMAEDLKWRYPAHPDDMAVILRGITVTSPDLCGLMDELDDLFSSPGLPR